MSDNDNVRHNCDTAIAALAKLLIKDGGATGELLLDRMLTFAAAQAVGWDGSAAAAAAFRQMADNIEAGAFARIEAQRERARH